MVEHGTEHGKVLCFLRYVKAASGWQKLSTSQANALLERDYPQYLHYSPVLDATLHGVDLANIALHHQPKQRLQQLLQMAQPDAVEQDLRELCQKLQHHGVDLTQIGITGSLLIGGQHHSSDLDLVCYDRAVFHHSRDITRQLIADGQLQALTHDDWQASYQRRDCALSFTDYVWHEQRKYNKAVINGRKFDLNFIAETPRSIPSPYQKQGNITVQCTIIDDSYGFDYPAEFQLDHPQFSSVVSFTATYTGQAINGERVEIAGLIEHNQHGLKRLVVGSTREAHGEYIKVIRA